MKLERALFIIAVLLAAGCHSKDEIALQRYTKISPGSVIILVTKANAKDYTSLPARKFDLLLTNECVLQEIRDGTVWVTNFNGKSLGFAGSMVKSIEVKETPTPPER